MKLTCGILAIACTCVLVIRESIDALFSFVLHRNKFLNINLHVISGEGLRKLWSALTMYSKVEFGESISLLFRENKKEFKYASFSWTGVFSFIIAHVSSSELCFVICFCGKNIYFEIFEMLKERILKIWDVGDVCLGSEISFFNFHQKYIKNMRIIKKRFLRRIQNFMLFMYLIINLILTY